MGPHEDPGIAAVLVRMGGVLLSEQTVERTLQLVTELTERTVGSASAVSITLRKDDQLYTSNASETVARTLDEVQYATEQGPCLEALDRQVIINTALAAARGRWPAFVDAALAEGMRSILSVPLTVGERSLGGLNIYSHESDGFDEAGETTASLLAQQGSAVLANVLAFNNATALNAQLNDALQSRDLIGQAKGILMEREACSAEAAFDILRRASQRTNRKLRDVAEDLVASASLRQGAAQ